MKRAVVAEAVAWIAALVLVAVALPLLSYGTRDADSRLYVDIAARLSAEPPSRWIAPEWPPGWYGTGFFVEHPVGVFLAPAALGAAGYPPRQAPYIANAVWQIASLLLAAALARRFTTHAETCALLFLLQLVPIAFTYRVRANHEQLLLLLLLAAVYAIERARTSLAWLPAVAAALVGLVLVKGLVGLVGLAVCALWLVCRGGEDAEGYLRRGGLALLAGVVGIGLATLGYEALYRDATGDSFLSGYLGRQLGPAMEPQSTALVTQKACNAVWYAGRLLWFPFPWSLGFLAAGWALARRLIRRPAGAGEPWRGLAFALGVTVLYLGLFSLSDRRADRYIFPAYFAVAAAGAVATMRAWSPARRLAAWLAATPAWSPAVLWLLLVLLHVGAGRLLHLPTIKVWGPSS